jgi:hypothetical protein
MNKSLIPLYFQLMQQLQTFPSNRLNLEHELASNLSICLVKLPEEAYIRIFPESMINFQM